MSPQIKTLLWWIGGTLGMVGLIFGLAKLGSGPNTANVAAIVAVNDADHVKGTASAPATLVEYSDFQCPACGYYYPIVKPALEQVGDKVRFVYRHYPLTTLHPYAQLAAQASEAAQLQGKFWEMHDLLFERQNSWTKATDVKSTLIGYAVELGLNKDTFTADIDSSAVKDRVQRDMTTGNQLRLSGTPSFFLNGKALATPFTTDQLVEKLNQAAGS